MKIVSAIIATLVAATTVVSSPVVVGSDGTARDVNSKRSVAFNWGSDKLRGVNLGGWLVLESFITPSLYNAAGSKAVDEWTYCETLGKPECLRRLTNHWNTWVTLADFQRIKKSGFNSVRVPIGFWAYADWNRPYVQGAAPYIDKAIGWARQTGLKIILDLHGAPGSQNGWEHSGHRGAVGWSANNAALTLTVLRSISKYAQTQYQDVVIAIELLNEPLLSSLDPNVVRDFYTKGYNLMRGVSDTPILLHDGFWGLSYWNGFLSWPNAKNVIMDHHEYQVFDNYLLGMTPAQHNTQVCASTNAFATSDKWTIVGEWSAALTDCAPNLNGRFNGARYDGTFAGGTYRGPCAPVNNVAGWSQTTKDNYRKYIETQIEYYERKTNGWIFWNFKTEGGAPEWDLYKLIDVGVFPQPITSRRFAKVCP